MADLSLPTAIFSLPGLLEWQTMVIAAPCREEEEKIRAIPWSLGSGVLNTLFALWTFSGSVFLLFLHELGLNMEQIGVLLSLFPFCGVLALGFAPVAARLGRKRVFLAGYGTRKVVMAGLLLLPWVLCHGGHRAGMLFLVAIICLFALLRAFAETAYYPWLQEFIPNRVRGKYTGVATVIGMLASVIGLLIAGWVIGAGTGLPRFLLLIGVGCCAGLLGVAAMAWVPGGRPLPHEASSRTHMANMREALRDRNLVAYLGGFGAVTMGALLLTSFLPLFLHTQLGVPAGTVVRLDTAVMLGSGISCLFWGWAADRVGSRPVLMPALAMHLLIPLGWLLLPRHATHLLAWCIALYAAYGIASGGVAIATVRLLFNRVVPPAKSTAYTALYYAWLGITSGLAPLLAGVILKAVAGWRMPVGPCVLDGYALLFLFALLLLGVSCVLFARVAPDDRYTTRMVLRRVLSGNARVEMP